MEWLMSVATETRAASGRTRPTGAVALVTGAARGIGAATARALAEDGWAIAVVHRGSADGAVALAEDISEAGGRALAISGDLCDVDDLASIYGAAEQLGPVLCLVNNAGMRADNLA